MNKIMKTLTTVLLFSSLAQAQSTGTIKVVGEAGKSQIFQKVKAIRCEVTQRGKCDAPVFFGLNSPQAVKAGSYIIGFENSLHPGFLMVESGQTVELVLEKITVPSQVRGEKIRVYRDLTAAVEQNKILLSMYTMNRHFFRLDKQNFGDLYLTGSWDRDFVQRFTYESCAKISSYTNAPADAVAVCTAWNTANQYSGLKEIYKFNADSTMSESWVTFPGDIVLSKHPRYLVATPMTESDFVSVFPGAYKVQAEGKGNAAVSVKAGSFKDGL